MFRDLVIRKNNFCIRSQMKKFLYEKISIRKVTSDFKN
jgi:hypothetical protein